MSVLYGRLTGDRAKTQATRQANEAINAQVEDWHGRVVVSLDAEGRFYVGVGSKTHPRVEQIARGTLMEEGWTAVSVREARECVPWDRRVSTNESQE